MGGSSGGQTVQPGGILGGMGGANGPQSWQNSPQWQRIQSAMQVNPQMQQLMSMFGMGGGMQGPGAQMPSGYNGGAGVGTAAPGGQTSPTMAPTSPGGGMSGDAGQPAGMPGGGIGMQAPQLGPQMLGNPQGPVTPQTQPWRPQWGRNPGNWGRM